MLAPVYTPYVVRSFFELTPRMNFIDMACSLHSFKLYYFSCKEKVKINCLTLEDFKDTVLKSLSPRLQAVIVATKIPTYDEVLKASAKLFNLQNMD